MRNSEITRKAMTECIYLIRLINMGWSARKSVVRHSAQQSKHRRVTYHAIAWEKISDEFFFLFFSVSKFESRTIARSKCILCNQEESWTTVNIYVCSNRIGIAVEHLFFFFCLKTQCWRDDRMTYVDRQISTKRIF